MVSGFLIMGGLGVAIGIVLALASKVFYVYVDPKIEAVEDALPGANCGGCGLPGCSSNAVAIVAGKASASSCVAGGPDVTTEIAMLKKTSPQVILDVVEAIGLDKIVFECAPPEPWADVAVWLIKTFGPGFNLENILLPECTTVYTMRQGMTRNMGFPFLTEDAGKV